MISPVSVSDIMQAVQSIAAGSSASIYIAFTIMCTFALCVGVKRLMTFGQ